MKGKTLSLASKILAGVIVLVLSILKGFKFVELEMGDIVLLGIFFALLFSPIDISIWLDKFTTNKK